MPSWGRWGAQDERGALNLLGPDDVISAAREIRTGQILPWLRRLRREGLRAGRPG